MKKSIVMIIVGLALLVVGAVTARASDFGLIKLSAPVVIGGSCIALDGSGSAAGGSVAIVTHKALPSDNVLASFIEGWVPVTVGGTVGGSLGKASISAGTGINLLPVARTSLLGLVNSVTNDSQAAALKMALSSRYVNTDATIFIGPTWGPVFSSLNKCQTKLMLQVAGALKFGSSGQ